MSSARKYSANNIEFVQQVYLEQLHYAVLTALAEKKNNVQASSAYIDLPFLGRRGFGDFARGYNSEKANEAAEPQELRVGQPIADSALMTTLKHMSYDKDFNGIAQLVGEINGLKMDLDVNAWSASIDRLTEKAQQTIADVRFDDLGRLFKPSTEVRADVNSTINRARVNYPLTVLNNEYAFSEPRPIVSKSTSMDKMPSFSMFGCLNFFHKFKNEYRAVRASSVESQREIDDSSIAGRATKLFAQYFKSRGMKKTWSAGVGDSKVPSFLKSQHKAAKEIINLLNYVRTPLGVIAPVVTRSFEISPMVRMAELMYEATQRQGLGYFVPKKPSQFAEALKGIAVALIASSDDESLDKELQRRTEALSGDYESAQQSVKDVKQEYSNIEAESFGRGQQVPTHRAAIYNDSIRSNQKAAKKQLGVNKCFDSIVMAVKASQASAGEQIGSVSGGESSTHTASNLGSPSICSQ